MNVITRTPSKSRLSLAISLLLALTLIACGSSFKEGAYMDSRFGTTYEFGPNGQGQIVGGVSGTPTFTYKLESDQIVISYGKDQPEAVFKRLNNKTLERHDGAQLVLQE